ncbi:MAG: helix-turn-helix domain-containing protein [Alphaproteobacteria bacterium]|nr:helix-turn-helix domain-containing protein [Alphaproteobacteria bacterium]
MKGWHERLRTALDRKGWSQAELSRRSGIGIEKIRKYYQGKVDQPRGDIVARLADTLDVEELWLRDGRGREMSIIPLIGYVGAGESFYPVDDLAQGGALDGVEFELDGADPIAIEVRGSSVSPVYRPGDRLLCSRLRGVDIETCVGKDCIVRLSTGEGYIKKLARGSRPDSYTLLSYNAEPIYDADLEWCAPVIWVRRAP